jgi:hypothetical protein
VTDQFTAGWLAGRDAAADECNCTMKYADNDTIWVYQNLEADIRALTPPVPASDVSESPDGGAS